MLFLLSKKAWPRPLLYPCIYLAVWIFCFIHQLFLPMGPFTQIVSLPLLMSFQAIPAVPSYTGIFVVLAYFALLGWVTDKYFYEKDHRRFMLTGLGLVFIGVLSCGFLPPILDSTSVEITSWIQSILQFETLMAGPILILIDGFVFIILIIAIIIFLMFGLRFLFLRNACTGHSKMAEISIFIIFSLGIIWFLRGLILVPA